MSLVSRRAEARFLRGIDDPLPARTVVVTPVGRLLLADAFDGTVVFLVFVLAVALYGACATPLAPGPMWS